MVGPGVQLVDVQPLQDGLNVVGDGRPPGVFHELRGVSFGRFTQVRPGGEQLIEHGSFLGRGQGVQRQPLVAHMLSLPAARSNDPRLRCRQRGEWAGWLTARITRRRASDRHGLARFCSRMPCASGRVGWPAFREANRARPATGARSRRLGPRPADKDRQMAKPVVSWACSRRAEPGAVEPADEAGLARVGLP
jgi:hypothetical protein